MVVENVEERVANERRDAELSGQTSRRQLPGRLFSRNRVMRGIRRIHLFTGIFMAPWLMIYGLSAFLFNHPQWFAPEGGAAGRPMPERMIAQSRLGAIPPPEQLAEQVVEAWNARGGAASGWTLSPGDKPFYAGNLVLDASGSQGRCNIQFDLNCRQGVFNPLATPDPSAVTQTRNPARLNLAVLDQPWQAALRDELTRLSAGSEQPLRNVNVQAFPELAFTAQSGGKTWNVRYRLNNGSAVANHYPARQKVIFLLRRLHLGHLYPPFFSLRTLWAIQVDVMASLLCIWALSGLVMWWQMKNLRRWGAIALGVALVIALLMGAGMYRLVL